MEKETIRKLIREILEEEGIDNLKIGKHTSYVTNDMVHISAAIPRLKLEGSETSAKNLSIREKGGVIQIYDEAAATSEMALESHAGRHGYAGADAINTLRFAQIKKVFKNVASQSITSQSTATISKGVYYVTSPTSMSVEFYDDLADSWKTIISPTGADLVISDGSNVRFKNTATTSKNPHLREIE